MNTQSDANAQRFPVSVKGVMLVGEQVILLKNERDEWELPGGKLEPGEDILECLAREIYEELSISARIGDLLDAWVYPIHAVEVVILTYDCHISAGVSPKVSHEHKEVGLFPIHQLDEIPLPDGYKKAIRDAYRQSRLAASGGDVVEPPAR
jgi:8-oxo-dGTP pyrophosphatase MutT (NUDIX family)